MSIIDFDRIKEILKNKWNFLIFVVIIKAIVFLIFFLANFQYFINSVYSFADHLYYTEMGTAISNGYFPSSQKTFGLPLIMAPFFAIFKPSYAGALYEPMKFIMYLYVLNSTSNYAFAYLVGLLVPLMPVSQSILLPWGIFNGLILGSLAPLALYKIVNNIYDNEKIALISALVFCLYPIIFIFNFTKFIHNTGFLELSDFTALVFMIFATYFFTTIEKNEKNKEESSLLNYIFLGIITGFAILIRISNVLMVICFIIFILFTENFSNQLTDFRQNNNIIIAFFKSFYETLKKKKKYIIPVIIIGFLVLLQLIYNKIHFGGFLTFGYNWYYDHFYRFQWALKEFRDMGFVGIDYLILTPNGYMSTTYMINGLLAIFSGYLIEIIFSIVGIVLLLIKKDKSLPFLVSWLLLFMLFYSMQGFTQLEVEAIRFLMPIIPIVCIFIGIDLFIVLERNFDWIKE
ncbi:MAG: glycosyltransferase family 39 protein [Candidatus Helarchaeota archaeon]